MTAPPSTSALIAADGDIARGDRLARDGEWSAALTCWRSALDGPDAAWAGERITWFLQETGGVASGKVPAGTRRPAYRTLLAATLAAVLGTIVTLVGVDRSGIEGTIIAAVAWICFAVAIGLSLLFARLLARPPAFPPSTPIDAETIAVAMSAASNIERGGSPR